MRPSWLPPLQQLDWAIREANNLSTDVTRLWRRARQIVSPLQVAAEYDPGGAVVHSRVISDSWAAVDSFIASRCGIWQPWDPEPDPTTVQFRVSISGWSGAFFECSTFNGDWTLSWLSTGGAGGCKNYVYRLSVGDVDTGDPGTKRFTLTINNDLDGQLDILSPGAVLVYRTIFRLGVPFVENLNTCGSFLSGVTITKL